MLEVKPLTTADHFVHAPHPIAGTRAVTPHAPTTAVSVTISPQAAALAAASQKQAEKPVRKKLPYLNYDEDPENGLSDQKSSLTED
jgi:hypothetical protein